MKKIIPLIILLMLLTLANIYASGTTEVEKNRFRVPVAKGWNLLVGTKGSYDTHLDSNALGDKNVLARYLFVHESKKYIDYNRVKSAQTQEQVDEILAEAGTTLDVLTNVVESDIRADWVYFDKEWYIIVEEWPWADEYFNQNVILARGWNFIYSKRHKFLDNK